MMIGLGRSPATAWRRAVVFGRLGAGSGLERIVNIRSRKLWLAILLAPPVPVHLKGCNIFIWGSSCWEH